MSAGLPGLGLGGLFFVLSALLAPAFEVVRAARGRSSPARRRQVARQFLMAVAMVAAVDLTLRAVLIAAGALGVGGGSADGLLVLPLTPLGITGGVLAALLVLAKLAELAFARRSPKPAVPARRLRRLRVLTVARDSGGS